MRRSLVLVLLLLNACEPVHPAVEKCDAPTSTHPRAAAFQEALERLTAGVVPGAAWAVRDANGVWSGASGLADVDHRVLMQSCHAFPIASVTKTFTAALVLQQVEAGELGLDDSIEHHLPPKLSARIRNADRITVRMLLDHSSGLPNYSDFFRQVEILAAPGADFTSEMALSRVADRSRAEPGTRVAYTGAGFLLAGLMLEDQTGSSMQDLYASRLFGPLMLESTRYEPDAAYSGTVRGYLDLHGDGAFIDSNWNNYVDHLRSPAAGISSTALDLLTFTDALQREGRVVSDASLEAMRRGMPGGSAESHERAFGLGLVVYDFGPELGEAYGHAGVMLGVTTRTYYFPRDDVTMVLMVNGYSHGFSGGVAERLERDVIPGLVRTVLVP